MLAVKSGERPGTRESPVDRVGPRGCCSEGKYIGGSGFGMLSERRTGVGAERSEALSLACDGAFEAVICGLETVMFDMEASKGGSGHSGTWLGGIGSGGTIL